MSSGTTAAIDTGAVVQATNVGVTARNHTRLDVLTGGAGFGAAVGLGLGIAVVTIDADVSAFISGGTVVNGIDGADADSAGDGSLSVVASLDSGVCPQRFRDGLSSACGH